MSLKRQRRGEPHAQPLVSNGAEVEKGRVATLSSEEISSLMSTEEKEKFDAEVAEAARLMPYRVALVKSSSASRGVLANPRSPVGPDLAKMLETVGGYKCEVRFILFCISTHSDI